jgi:hypothetical protein
MNSYRQVTVRCFFRKTVILSWKSAAIHNSYDSSYLVKGQDLRRDPAVTHVILRSNCNTISPIFHIWCKLTTCSWLAGSPTANERGKIIILFLYVCTWMIWKQVRSYFFRLNDSPRWLWWTHAAAGVRMIESYPTKSYCFWWVDDRSFEQK